MALTVAMVICVNAAAARLRRLEPELARPFRIPLYPLPIVLAVLINLALLAALVLEDPLHSLEGFGFLLVVGITDALIRAFRTRDVSPAG